jgi:ABC transporter substrate binding protein
MKRREFIAGLGGAAVWPLTARAQQGERVRRVGVLTYGLETQERSLRSILSDHLEQLGWSEGRNLRLDFRFGDGDVGKTSAFAADLVQLAPDVIVTFYRLPFEEVQRRTKTIPIVAVGGGDLLENGMVRNLSHPEGNATGFPNVLPVCGWILVGRPATWIECRQRQKNWSYDAERQYRCRSGRNGARGAVQSARRQHHRYNHAGRGVLCQGCGAVA